MGDRRRTVARRLGTLSDETFSSLRVRNFRLFFLGQGTSQIGNWLTFVAQILLVLKITGDGVAVGVLTACQFAPVLVLGAWTGLVADRSDKRKLLITVQFFAMAQSFGIAALAFMDHPPLVGLYAVALAGGVAFAFDNPARRTFVVEMVPDDLVHNAVSLNSAMMTTARVLGPAIAGLLISTVGYGWCFVADGLTYLPAIVAFAAMRASELRSPPATIRARGQIREGLRYAARVPELAIPLLMTVVIGTLAFNFQVVFPLMVTRTFHSAETSFTLLFSVISLGSLAGALQSARRRSVDIRDVAVAAGAFGIAMLMFAAAPSLAWAYPLGVIVGFTSVSFLTASTAIVQVHAAAEMRGRILALQAIVFLGSTPIGGPLLGWFADTFGPRAAVALGGTATCAAAIWGVLADRRRLRGLPETPEPTDPDALPIPEPA